ncbi:helix-hairpin-helix domain-containing protein [Bacillus sp. REN16]|uniref:helix-hairpin-helix domain-containing protein n=1 Tax=Bacillus sp. REN16 TaxID=2887296 RepID=UPI001E57CA0C|nr:helix-hairpin-helix domain-containing protein [Bacillus sp. REN16]MCC3356651.1 helix-hairpin-helix domain-containing protein [Bacillus sp. REN16]
MSIKDNRIKLLVIICGICLIIFVVFYFIFGRETNAEPNIEEEELLLEPVIEDVPVVEEEVKVILVDIKGAVHNEGVFEVQEGMRVKDVVLMAGGFTEEAEHVQVNLAERVQDEMVIYVPRIGEEITIGTSGHSQKDEGKVSLNKGTQAELETLSGIGPSKAAAIISYREEHGPFKQLEDLLEVSGIGEKSFEKIKDQIKLN